MPQAIDTHLLNLLRETCFGDGKAYFASLPPSEQQALCLQMQTPHLCCWCYRMLHDVLPPEVQSHFRRDYLYRSAQVARQQKMKEELFALLENAKIRFAPIKGADLAFELYPAPVMRYFCDLDILIHPEDCPRVLDVLQEAQWQEIPGHAIPNSHHHYPVRAKNKVALEAHKTLPNFDNIPPAEIWKHIHPITPGGSQHRLAPELRLMLLFRHALDHSEESVCKMLLDAALILKQSPVDMEYMQQLAQQWKLPYPGHFLAAVPEFFPEEFIQKAGSTPEAAALFRQFFDDASACNAVPHSQAVMSRNIWSRKWWISRWNSISPDSIRNKYLLPKQGAYGRLLKAYSRDLPQKLGQALRYLFRRDRNVQAYSRTVEKIDRYEK